MSNPSKSTLLTELKDLIALHDELSAKRHRLEVENSRLNPSSPTERPEGSCASEDKEATWEASEIKEENWDRMGRTRSEADIRAEVDGMRELIKQVRANIAVLKEEGERLRGERLRQEEEGDGDRLS